MQKSQFCHSRSDSERESGSNCLKNHIRPRMPVSGIETFGDDKQFCKRLIDIFIDKITGGVYKFSVRMNSNSNLGDSS